MVKMIVGDVGLWRGPSVPPARKGEVVEVTADEAPTLLALPGWSLVGEPEPVGEGEAAQGGESEPDGEDELEQWPPFAPPLPPVVVDTEPAVTEGAEDVDVTDEALEQERVTTPRRRTRSKSAR
jgi:hypothetical protein